MSISVMPCSLCLTVHIRPVIYDCLVVFLNLADHNLIEMVKVNNISKKKLSALFLLS